MNQVLCNQNVYHKIMTLYYCVIYNCMVKMQVLRNIFLENTQKAISKINEKRQENPVVWWVVVIVAVIAIVVLMAACKKLGGEYAGSFKVLGILEVKVKCKS